MGNSFSPAPNQVDIKQNGGCSGGGSCGFAAPEFDSVNMDPRLASYLTQKEYSDVLVNANNVLKNKAPTCKVLFCVLPFALIAAVLFIVAISNPPKYMCEAPNGLCREGQNPVSDSCCLATCCKNKGRRLEDELANLEDLQGVSEQRLPDQNSEKNYSTITGADATYLRNSPNANANTTQSSSNYAYRALLSRRSDRRLQRSECEQWTEGKADNIATECMCTQSGKNRHCAGSVSIQGQHKKDEGLRWMLSMAIPVHVIGTMFPLGYVVYFNCELPRYVNAVLEPWTRKGLQASYRRGSKHYQARISVFTPQVPTVVGQVVP